MRTLTSPLASLVAIGLLLGTPSTASAGQQPPRPPSVAFSPWDSATNTLGAPRELVTGFQNEDGTRWGRSVTAVPGPDRSIYLTDDQAGLVYRLTPPA